MSRKRLLVLVFGAAIGLAGGYGAVAKAWPTPYYTGYFTGAYDTAGTDVLPDNSDTLGCAAGGGNAIPSSINTTNEFITFIKCKLASNNDYGPYRARERTGAAFIIQTMIGNTGSKITSASDSRVAEWERRVRYYSYMGWINWSTTASYSYNSYYQGGSSSSSPNDDAFYSNSSSAWSITFSNGSTTYKLRRQCGNPTGITALANNPDFDIDGYSTVSSPTVYPGDTVEFRHYLSSDGNSSPITINWSVQNMPAGTTLFSGNAGTFTAQTKYVKYDPYTVPLGTAAGTQICRRIAFNPEYYAGGSDVGSTVCTTVVLNYSLTPSVNVLINGAAVSGNIAEPGDSITFTYAVANGGTTASDTVTCTYRQANNVGYSTAAPTTTFTPSGANCAPSRTFPTGSTTVATESGVTASANTSVCRSLTITPVTASGGSLTGQACAHVAAKPYFRVYGGDVSAGGGLSASSGSCSLDTGAAVIGWNKRSGGSYAGAGVQFAAYALSKIFDTATSPNTSITPHGLAFANTGASVASGNFGGDFGSVPCAPDYYSSMPSSTSSIPATVATMTNGSYSGVGDVTLGGGSIINPNNRITVYVDGNVFISSNITYAGSWDSGSIPMFRLIVRGNIFIDNDVTQLDGLYVAQPDGGAGGIIYTCASGAAPFTPLALSGTLGSFCDNKLTVNGSFAARQVQFLRTIGTLRQSDAAETSGSANIAEVFNYSPIMWIPQPSDEGDSAQFDAINTLPPIL